MRIQTFLFSNARNKTNDNFSVVGDFIFLAFFQLNILILVRVIKEMRTLIQPMGEENHTQQIREVFKFNIQQIIVINQLKFRGQSQITSFYKDSSGDVIKQLPHLVTQYLYRFHSSQSATMKQYDFEKKFIRVIERNSLSMLIIYCCHYSDLALKHAR